ncbi:hypothetical protein HY642_02590 [Candidatus Woesearchaeota archaeon]|nr:hypothetical protein [Candidatus Woesearchaeota archaeon]
MSDAEVFARRDRLLSLASFAYAALGTAYGVYDDNAPIAVAALANVPLGLYFRTSRNQRLDALNRISELERKCRNPRCSGK